MSNIIVLNDISDPKWIYKKLKQERSVGGGSSKNDKTYPQKEKDKNFIISLTPTA